MTDQILGYTVGTLKDRMLASVALHSDIDTQAVDHFMNALVANGCFNQGLTMLHQGQQLPSQNAAADVVYFACDRSACSPCAHLDFTFD